MFGGYKPEAPDANRLGNIAKRLVAVVKQYDKSRPVTAGLAGVAMSNETEYPGALDIQGYNYTESRYGSDHREYPDRVLFGSETRHDLAAWKAVTSNEHVFGQFIWTGIDYLGESGRWPSRGFYSGLLDFAGFIKPRGYFRKALWSSEPTIYLGTSLIWNRRGTQPSMDAWSVWNYEEGQNISVGCYTNAAKVQLLLNDQPVGGKTEYDPKTGIISWDVPYKAGKLEAIGYDENDTEITRCAIQTSKQPFAVRVEKTATEKGLSQIAIQVVDEDGVPVMMSDNDITCLVSGPAKLLGLEAGNNSDMGGLYG
ncbi:MAG: DUF4982 domain-containing protein [Mangrovibacterium sp.]